MTARDTTIMFQQQEWDSDKAWQWSVEKIKTCCLITRRWTAKRWSIIWCAVAFSSIDNHVSAFSSWTFLWHEIDAEEPPLKNHGSRVWRLVAKLVWETPSDALTPDCMHSRIHQIVIHSNRTSHHPIVMFKIIGWKLVKMEKYFFKHDVGLATSTLPRCIVFGHVRVICFNCQKYFSHFGHIFTLFRRNLAFFWAFSADCDPLKFSL